MIALRISTLPPLLKTPPPPSWAALPLPSLSSISTSCTRINPVPFHNPPPSWTATFPVYSPPKISISPGPVMCIPPPFPGAGPVKLLRKFEFLIVIFVPAPDRSSNPPPALRALLSLTSQSSIVIVPPTSLKIPPPLPRPISAILFVMMQFFRLIVPPLLKTPPPPSSAPSPLATLLSMNIPSTFITPLPFHSPPPSRKAIFLRACPRKIFIFPLPVI